MRMNHVPKDVSDRDPKRDWDRDLNYVRSFALQTPFQSRSGSAHCEVIFCSYCAVCTDWPMHGFSMASARISKMHTHESRSERALRSHVLESGFLRESRSQTSFFSQFKMRFKSLIWNSFAFTKTKIRLSNQERAESRSETSFGMWFVLMWTGPLCFAPPLNPNPGSAPVALPVYRHLTACLHCQLSIVNWGWISHC